METEFKALEKLVLQIQEFLQEISTAEYCQELEIYDCSSIGKHCRHIHDFLYTLCTGVHTQQLDYSRRDRKPELEKNPRYLAETLRVRLNELKDFPFHHKVYVLPDYGPQRPSHPSKHLSTFGRELLFVIHHTIHHMAMIKMGVKQLDSSILLPAEFGLAPSTIAFNTTKPTHE